MCLVFTLCLCAKMFLTRVSNATLMLTPFLADISKYGIIFWDSHHCFAASAVTCGIWHHVIVIMLQFVYHFHTDRLGRSILFPRTVNGNCSGWFSWDCSRNCLSHKFKFSNVDVEVTSNISTQPSTVCENDIAIDREHLFPGN